MQQLFSHFLELKYRSFYIFLSFLLNFFTCYLYQKELVYLIGRPFVELNQKFIFIDPTEAFYIIIEVSFLLSFLCLFPYIIYQFWCFFLPSCYKYERIFVNKILVIFFVFFFIELVFIYLKIFPEVCKFLLSFEISSFNQKATEPLFVVELSARIKSYVHLIFQFFFFLILLFQIPFCFFSFFYFKWLTSYTLCRNRKFFFFVFVFFSALFSPPDAISQIWITCFLYCIYEILIIMGLFLEKLEIHLNLNLSKNK
jgi:sec-independent protein translocase protein TatC